jgi:hypothetical protein
MPEVVILCKVFHKHYQVQCLSSSANVQHNAHKDRTAQGSLGTEGRDIDCVMNVTVSLVRLCKLGANGLAAL